MRQNGTVTLTEDVDPGRGAVRVRGHLTVQGADLLRGTVENLRRRGHERVLLDLAEVRAVHRAGMRVLRELARTVAADGGELLLVAPTGTVGAPVAQSTRR